MPRPRKSRLLPSLQTVAEELVRHIGQHVEGIVTQKQETLMDELKNLRKEVSQIQRRALRAPSGGKVGRPRSDRACSVQACTQPHVARGLCKNHYQQMRYVEKKAASGLTVRRRRASGALAPILEIAKARGVTLAGTPVHARTGNGARRRPEAAIVSPIAEG